MTANINNFGVINFYENNNAQPQKERPQHVCEDVTPVQDNKPAPAQLCPYIQVDKLNEIGVYTPEQFNELMAKEAKQSAPKFAEFLHKHQKTGYLHFGKDNKQQVFDTLRTFYPTMKGYKYNNFALYF